MGVRVSRPLCRNPHVLLVADAELDLDLAIMLDLKSFRGSVWYLPDMVTAHQYQDTSCLRSEKLDLHIRFLQSRHQPK